MQITFYGFVYALAIIIIYIILRNFLNLRYKKPNLAYLGAIYFTLGSLIGARIFYILFYSFGFFIDNPSQIFFIWKGGLSFHGGLLGFIILGYIFCKKNNIDFLELSDMIVIPLSFFLAVGKIANYFNSELYGKITNVFWCVRFDDIPGCRHPVQIYEFFKNIFILFFLIYLKSKKLKKGIVLITFVFLYAFLRFFIDFFRDYQSVYMSFGTGQYLNIITFIASGYFLIKFLRNKTN